MLALVLLSLVLIAVALGIGLLFQRLCGIAAGNVLADDFFLATWLGLLLIGGCFMAAAVLVPIGPKAAAAIVAAGGAACWLERERIGLVLRALGGQDCYWPAVLTIGLAAFDGSLIASKDVSLTDVGIYHLPQAIWLSHDGLVRGLALLHHRFGYNSIWLSLLAPISALSPENKLTSLGGALVFTLLVIQGAYSFARVATAKDRVADWFLIGALVPAFVTRDVPSLIVSSSPDFAVYALIVVFGWSILIRDSTRATAPVIMLAAGAVAVKISAAPVLVGALALLIWTGGSLREYRAALLFSVLTLGSVATANFITSGCFLFPVAATCVSPSWGVPPDTATAISRYISQWPILLGSAGIRDYINGTAPTLTILERLSGWSTSGIAACLAMTGCGAAYAWRLRSVPVAILTATAVVGLFLALSAPAYRFAVGWIGLLAGLSAAFAGSLLSRYVRERRGAAYSHSIIVASIAALAFAGLLASVSKEGDRELAESGFENRPTPLLARLVIPPPVVNREVDPAKGMISGTRNPLTKPLRLVEKRDHDVVFVQPEMGAQCWAVRLPCTPPDEPFNPIRLRSPSRGIAAGIELAEH